jgi:hypothetical protein
VIIKLILGAPFLGFTKFNKWESTLDRIGNIFQKLIPEMTLEDFYVCIFGLKEGNINKKIFTHRFKKCFYNKKGGK